MAAVTACHVFHWQVKYTFKDHRDICLFVCFCLIVQDLSWETVVSASVLVHCLALIKFYVFYINYLNLLLLVVCHLEFFP